MDPDLQMTDLRICKIYVSTDYTCYVLTYSDLTFKLYQISLRSYANMELVEEFEQHILSSAYKKRDPDDLAASRQISYGEPILSYN